MKYLNKKVEVKSKSGTLIGIVKSETIEKLYIRDESGVDHIIDKATSVIKIIEMANVLIRTLSSFWETVKNIFK